MKSKTIDEENLREKLEKQKKESLKKCEEIMIAREELELQERKAFLDNIMKEYYYEKNNVEMTLEFLSYMFTEYEKLINPEEE